MSPVRLSVSVTGQKELERGTAAATVTLRDETRLTMTTGLLLLEAEMRRRAPRDTGRLQGSIRNTISGTGANLTGRVGPSVRYALFVERGTKPHDPPIAAIRGWARRHGVNPFALAKSIGKKGTQPQPFVAPSLEAQRGRIEELFARIGARVAISMTRGR